jgi:chromosome segregation ATPase
MDVTAIVTTAITALSAGGIGSVVTGVLTHRRLSRKQAGDHEIAKEDRLFNRLEARLTKVEAEADECARDRATFLTNHEQCLEQHRECEQKHEALQRKVCDLEDSVIQLRKNDDQRPLGLPVA